MCAREISEHRQMQDILVHRILILPMLSNKAITGGLFVSCIGTHAHGRQVTSKFTKKDVII